VVEVVGYVERVDVNGVELRHGGVEVGLLFKSGSARLTLKVEVNNIVSHSNAPVCHDCPALFTHSILEYFNLRDFNFSTCSRPNTV
jgi:hypothetical protein